MLALPIAIAALGLASYAVYLTRKVHIALAAFAEMGPDDDEEAEPEAAELWVSDGDLHTMDQAALYEATGAMALCVSEGVPCAVVKGQGVVSLHKLLGEKPRPQAVK